MAKGYQVIAKYIPDGAVKDSLRSAYYSLYYNRKHFAENGFRVNYSKGRYAFTFDNGVRFEAYENMADELKRSLGGYLAWHRLKAGETVVDCGAYIGEFTLYAASAVGPAGRVVAFEPDANIVKRLEANIALNRFRNVTVVRKGVWSKDGVLSFVGDSVKGYSFMFADKGALAVDVPVASLDSELGRLGVEKADFIKVDIEGAELEMVRGASATLGNGKPALAIASYHSVDGDKTAGRLETMLRSMGYRVETGHPQHLTTYARKEN